MKPMKNSQNFNKPTLLMTQMKIELKK